MTKLLNELFKSGQLLGDIDCVDSEHIGGWLYSPRTPCKQLSISVLVDGSRKAQAVANAPRPDLVTTAPDLRGRIGFHINTPLTAKDGEEHSIDLICDELNTSLLNEPLICKFDTGRFLKCLKIVAEENETHGQAESLSLCQQIRKAIADLTHSKTIQSEAISEILESGAKDGCPTQITAAFLALIKHKETSRDQCFIIPNGNGFIFARSNELTIQHPKQQTKSHESSVVIYEGLSRVPEDQVAPAYSYTSTRRSIITEVFDITTPANHIWHLGDHSEFAGSIRKPLARSACGSHASCVKATDFVKIFSTTRRISTFCEKSMSIGIVIPMYSRADLTLRLLRSIFRDPKSRRLNLNIYIYDDHPLGESDWVKEAQKIGFFSYKKNSTNLGFLQNCNKAFRETSEDIVILVNTDIELPPNWIERALKPFEMENVALATALATDGENLTVKVPMGATWLDADRALSWEPPDYPDACTAIGYFMAIRRSLIAGDLFEQKYGHGYGEDSDLHYRVKSRGFRSIVIDNLLVRHDHGSSYSIALEVSRSTQRQQAHSLFMSDWGKTHLESLNIFNSRCHYWESLGHNQIAKHSSGLSVLFISPSMDTRSGGVKVIFGLCEALCRAGIRSSIALLGDGERYSDVVPHHINPFPGIGEIYAAISSIEIVISTCYDTITTAETIANDYNCDHFNLAQGPECLFDAGVNFCIYEKLIALPRKVLSVSEGLSSMLASQFQRETVNITYGPCQSTFIYRRSSQIHSLPGNLQLAISLNTTREKGAGYSLLIASAAKAIGFKVVGFGNFPNSMVPAWVDYRGWCTDIELAAIFSDSAVYIETSYYEGLGLLALEAAFCGCIPLIRYNCSAETIFHDISAQLMWSSYNECLDKLRLIYDASKEDRAKLASSANKYAIRYNKQLGESKFVSEIREQIRKRASKD